ncbi:uncharacterized protein BO80DRAFT_427227 [Aspergillus ibericus CBS 121593]|uniref:Uncharacterized protein n=1 Tax=Aspergillus ibericus CBS 121593 TaxID=1448316 RepID=A0A395GUH9_9EURO|nr:hypothetical protein BO80DRAFT_427227 [Aspergillus ibericus CBS 121593]RAK98628.1 hypothetical protein BO80DRAFT_427227 [Aspergillus ibericus CBS 121593]
MVIIVSCIAVSGPVTPEYISARNTQQPRQNVLIPATYMQTGVLDFEGANLGTIFSLTPLLQCDQLGMYAWQCTISWTALIELH